MTYSCRNCEASLDTCVIDLGHHPPSNAYLSESQLLQPEKTYPLKVYICKKCWLMQLPEHASSQELFTPDYAYFSSTSKSWCLHAKSFVNYAVQRLGLNSKSHVIEIASNDGYLLQYVKEKGISCLGIEPTSATAEFSKIKGINTIEKFFDFEISNSLDKADLVIANNVLAHVPNVKDFVRGIANVLKRNGQVSIEFPHLLRLLVGNQFDTIYHEHYSYFSLKSVENITSSVGLSIIDVEEISTHGGSLRVWLSHEGTFERNSKVEEILNLETAAGLENIEAYLNFQKRAEETKFKLLEYLIKKKKDGKKILGYGAAAKGCTLLNYAGIKSDLIPAVADAAKSKQGKYLPGSHIPIITPEQFNTEKSDMVLVFPWNIISELKVKFQSNQIITAIPSLKIWD